MQASIQARNVCDVRSWTWTVWWTRATRERAGKGSSIVHCAYAMQKPRTKMLQSKLEELAAEVRNIKEAVASGPASKSSATAVVAAQLPPTHLQSPSARGLPYMSTGGGIPPSYPSLPTVNPPFQAGPISADIQAASSSLSKFSRPRAAGQVAEPRALASSVFSGEDIDYYFDK